MTVRGQRGQDSDADDCGCGEPGENSSFQMMNKTKLNVFSKYREQKPK